MNPSHFHFGLGQARAVCVGLVRVCGLLRGQDRTRTDTHGERDAEGKETRQVLISYDKAKPRGRNRSIGQPPCTSLATWTLWLVNYRQGEYLRQLGAFLDENEAQHDDPLPLISSWAGSSLPYVRLRPPLDWKKYPSSEPPMFVNVLFDEE